MTSGGWRDGRRGCSTQSRLAALRSLSRGPETHGGSRLSRGRDRRGRCLGATQTRWLWATAESPGTCPAARPPSTLRGGPGDVARGCCADDHARRRVRGEPRGSPSGEQRTRCPPPPAPRPREGQGARPPVRHAFGGGHTQGLRLGLWTPLRSRRVHLCTAIRGPLHAEPARCLVARPPTSDPF